MGLSLKTRVPSLYPSLAFRALGPNLFFAYALPTLQLQANLGLCHWLSSGPFLLPGVPSPALRPRIYFCVTDDMQPFRLMVRPYSKQVKCLWDEFTQQKQDIQLFPVFINSLEQYIREFVKIAKKVVLRVVKLWMSFFHFSRFFMFFMWFYKWIFILE